MATAAIDLDALNELFENQNKLDDIFNSIFDDDLFLSSSNSSDDHTLGESAHKGKASQDPYCNENSSFYAEEEYFDPNKRRITLFFPVIVEIAVVSYCIMHFT